eukprot:CAMPEP_0202979030 /NCGR_PEP_ID=MMETSP1396-20130829/85299_1 /ASSEMBLY_ACC=CAM_ASM_000872 /TAXON_ID= /ORGANISM="Pseudokeronopsis sp., Strain Brazil" /LENGTH=95 /DNA_ID=CAMNT_0049718283 /DNA_START=715 /DNA_END=1002 /DNA_ORIENTATION=+
MLAGMLSSIYYLIDHHSKTLLLKVDLFNQNAPLDTKPVFTSLANPICHFMAPFNGFDAKTHPYIFALESNQLKVIDLKSFQARELCSLPAHNDIA